MTQAYLPKDKANHAIQVLKPSLVVNVTVSAGGSNVMATALSADTNVIRLMSTVDTYVSIGPSGSAAATSTSFYLPAFYVEYFRVDEGNTTNAAYAVAGMGVAGAGTLNITEMV